ncbi:MAG TPA: RNA-binding cell elongation regulator Jag/EloR [Acidimicrobiales bacterium]
MEWVETTGRTVEEALDAALDQLGVHEDDAEYEVLEEPKVGLFGRVRGEARVRARVRPTKPRPKEDRRDRKRRKAAAATSADGADGGDSAAEVAERDADDGGAATGDTDGATEPEPAAAAKRKPRRSGGQGRGKGGGRGDTNTGDRQDREDAMSETGTDVPLAEQGEVAADFLRGVVERFELEGTVDVREVDEDIIEVAVHGDDLGLLIGPKGATLASLQELTRTVVQRKTSARNGRIFVDVSGYRQRRKEALERFAQTAAERVLSSGVRVVLDPMPASDRKIIHDAVNDIAGVATTSEGEEPRRRVVLLPDD